MRIQLETIKQAAAIIEASVKPIEAITDMRVINVGGLTDMIGGQGSGNGGGNNGGSSGNIADDLVNGLLKYRGLAPIVDNILSEVGIEPSSVQGLTKSLENVTSTTEVKVADAKVEAKPVVPKAPQKPATASAQKL